MLKEQFKTNKNMKKIIMTLMLCCIGVAQASAQDIFTEVKNLMDGYQKIKEDTSQDLDVRKVATFKWDAIYYMVYKATDETESELGMQVDAMIDFVNTYLAELQEAKGTQNKQLVRSKFKQASLENSLYNDTDKELTYAYVDNQNFLTQFSLDTNWAKALELVKKK